VNPLVRYMIVCEDVRRQPSNPSRIDLIGLLSAMTPNVEPAYPYVCPNVCVFVLLTECRGDGNGRIEIVESDTGRTVRLTKLRRIKLPTNPLAIEGFFFRLEGTVFPRAGLYDFVFWYNEAPLERQPLEMR